jgi:hypothetical protein
VRNPSRVAPGHSPSFAFAIICIPFDRTQACFAPGGRLTRSLRMVLRPCERAIPKAFGLEAATQPSFAVSVIPVFFHSLRSAFVALAADLPPQRNLHTVRLFEPVVQTLSQGRNERPMLSRSARRRSSASAGSWPPSSTRKTPRPATEPSCLRARAGWTGHPCVPAAARRRPPGW